MAQTAQDTQIAPATAAAQDWWEAKKDEREAQKVLDAAKKRRQAAADTLLMLGAEDGDRLTIYGNRTLTFRIQNRTTYGYKGALDAVRPLLTAAQDGVVAAHLDANATRTQVVALRG